MQQKNQEQIFRKESLERLSSPEQLDQLVQVVGRRAWLPLGAIGFLLFVAAIWSVVGRIPVTVSGQGILLQPRRVVQLQAQGNGMLQELKVKSGQRVKRGDVIGLIDQPELRQQLQQERNRLADLLRQNQDTGALQQLRVSREQMSLTQQRTILQESLRNAQAIVPVLRDKGLRAIGESRRGLEQRMKIIRESQPKLRQRLEARRKLNQEKLITDDLVLEAEREYLDSLTQISDLEAELKNLEVQETDARRQYMEGISTIDNIRNNIRQVDAQLAQLAQQDLETNLGRDNQVREVNRRISQLELQLTNQSKITSQYDGVILELGLVPGQTVTTGTRIGSLEAEDPNAKLVNVAYFSDSDGKLVKPGMPVRVTPSIVKRERFGGILGNVTEVTPFPVTVQDMTAVIGNPELAATLANNRAPIQIYTELTPDQATATGYKWSSSSGPPLRLMPGTTTTVQVRIGERAPISYVIPIMRSLTGVY